MEQILVGTTDHTILVFIPDPASTDGSGKTGLNAAALTVSYTRVETDNDVVVTDVTGSLSDLSALTDAHSDWGVKEVSNTVAPGLYRLDVADAVFAAGAESAVVYAMITSSAAAATPKAFQLVAYNPLDGVRLGLSALPNVAYGEPGGLGRSSVLHETTIAALTSQTVWTLTAGSADDNAYRGALVIVQDAATATQKAMGIVESYLGAGPPARQITLAADPGIYTMAVGDKVTLIADPMARLLLDRLTAGRAILMDNLGDLDAPVSGLSTLSAAEVHTEVVNAIAADTYAELLGVPPASASAVQMLGWLYLLARNKTIQNIGGSQRVRNDADSGDVASSTNSDDGTDFTRSKWT